MPAQDFQLRRAGPADAPAISEIFLAARRAAMPWLPVLHGREATVAFFRDVVLARAEVWIDAAADGELAGFIAFGGGEVEHLYVAPVRQRQGIGRSGVGRGSVASPRVANRRRPPAARTVRGDE